MQVEGGSKSAEQLLGVARLLGPLARLAPNLPMHNLKVKVKSLHITVADLQFAAAGHMALLSPGLLHQRYSTVVQHRRC